MTTLLFESISNLWASGLIIATSNTNEMWLYEFLGEIWDMTVTSMDQLFSDEFQPGFKPLKTCQLRAIWCD